MPVWSFHIPTDRRFARLNNRWVSRPYTRCSACGTHFYAPINHLEVEWDDGSETIGDFLSTIGPTILRRTHADQLLERFPADTEESRWLDVSPS